jgi:hypothetical protein
MPGLKARVKVLNEEHKGNDLYDDYNGLFYCNTLNFQWQAFRFALGFGLPRSLLLPLKRHNYLNDKE